MIFLHCVFIISTCPFRGETTRITSLCESGKFSAEFCQFSGLSISGSGGAICVTIVSETFSIRNCYFVSCTATSYGGGVYVDNSNEVFLEFCCGELCISHDGPMYALHTKINESFSNRVSFITCSRSSPNNEGSFQTLYQRYGNISSTDVNSSNHKLSGHSAMIAYNTNFAHWSRCTFANSILGSVGEIWGVYSSIMENVNFIGNSFNSESINSVIAYSFGSHRVENAIINGNSFASTFYYTTATVTTLNVITSPTQSLNLKHIDVHKCLNIETVPNIQYSKPLLLVSLLVLMILDG